LTVASVEVHEFVGSRVVTLTVPHDGVEDLTPEAARKLAVTLMSAAGRAERATVAPDWP
jgi:hypothetical protein